MSEERLALYQAGLNDTQIAKRQGVRKESVREWRNRKGLPPNHTSTRHLCPEAHALRMKLYEAGHTDRAIGKLLGGIDHAAIFQWRKRNGLPAHEIMANPAYEDVFHKFTGTSLLRALDAFIPSTEGLRLYDVIPDDRMSEWLEEMGATVWQ